MPDGKRIESAEVAQERGNAELSLPVGDLLPVHEDVERALVGRLGQLFGRDLPFREIHKARDFRRPSQSPPEIRRTEPAAGMSIRRHGRAARAGAAAPAHEAGQRVELGDSVMERMWNI